MLIYFSWLEKIKQTQGTKKVLVSLQNFVYSRTIYDLSFSLSLFFFFFFFFFLLNIRQKNKKK
jgi:predicted PurR-regulated permease PerM